MLPAVDGVSFELSEGESVAVVGESGSGKTQLARAILGLSPPGARVAGRMALPRAASSSGSPRREWQALRGAEIGLVFQEPAAALDPVRTVGAEIEESIRLHSRGVAFRARGSWRARPSPRWRFPIPTGGLDEYPHRLSGGLRQRAHLASVLAAGPKLLLADEPTASLDATVAREILDLLDRLRRERGLTVLIITHDLGVVARHCDRLLVVYAGRIVEEAPTRALFAAPAAPLHARACCGRCRTCAAAARLVGERYDAIPGALPDLAERGTSGCAFAPRCAERFEPCEAREPELYATPTGRGALLPPRDRPPGRGGPVSEPLLLAEGLEKRFTIRRGLFGSDRGSLPALRGVSFRIDPGRTLGLVGESGSGKTTAGRIVARLLEPDAGRILFGGTDWLALRGPGAAPPPPRAAGRLPGPAVVAEPAHARRRPGRRAPADPEARARAGARRARGRAARRRRALADRSARASPRSSRAASASASRSRARSRRSPRLIVCDEPVSALDVSVAAQIVNLLIDLRERSGLVLPLHLARPRRRRAPGGPDLRLLPRPRRRGGPDRRADGAAASSLHGGARRGGARPGPRGAAAARRALPGSRRRPNSRRPAAPFIPAARSRGTVAGRSVRPWRKSLRGATLHAFFRAKCRDMRTYRNIRRPAA